MDALPDKCPICGWAGTIMFVSFRCSNPKCQNYYKGYERNLKADRYILYNLNDEEWLIGFEYKDGLACTLWATTENGKYMLGAEFDDYIGCRDHKVQESEETMTFYRKYGFCPDEAKSQAIVLNNKAERVCGWWDRLLNGYN